MPKKIPEITSEDQSIKILVDNLLYLFRSMRRRTDIRSVKSEFTVPQAIVLGCLARFGELSVKELSQKVGLSHSTISGIVDRLERKEMAVRFQDPGDRRLTKVRITGPARKFLEVKHRQMFSDIADLFKRAAPGDQAKILEGLAVLRRLLEKED